MIQAGGPPAGLMSHAASPDGDGLFISEVLCAESEGQPYIDDGRRPLFAEGGLNGHATVGPPGRSLAGRDVPAPCPAGRRAMVLRTTG